MLDFGKLTETIGAMLSGSQQQPPVDGNGIAELLSNAGIDPAQLAGLGHNEILELLQQYGIDPTGLDVGQICELLQNGNVGGNLAEIAQSWLSSRGS